MSEGKKIIAQNKKARFNYSIEDSIECGIVLEGTEVKSFKTGNISFPDSFAEIQKGEVWVKNLHISEYPFSSVFNHDPDRPKKLLLKRDEIKRLERKVEEKMTVKTSILEPVQDTYYEETRFEVKPSLWQRIKNSKLVRTISYITKIRIRLDVPALPEGRGEEN